MKPTLIVSTSGTNHLAQTLATALNLPWIKINSNTFPNEELRVSLTEAGTTTLLLGSLSRPVNARIMEYVLSADAITRLGCTNLIGILTWYAYSKQDKVFSKGEPLSAQVIATMLEHVGFSSLYTLDLHNPDIQAFFNLPVTNISAVSLFVDYLQKQDLTNTVVVSPDKGSIKNATDFANLLHLPLVNATKTRDLTTGQVTIHGLSQPIRSKNILVFDDMIATGGTLIHLADYLHLEGAHRITVCCTHHLYLDGIQALIDASPIDSLIVSNSIAKPESLSASKLTILDITDTLANKLASVLK